MHGILMMLVLLVMTAVSSGCRTATRLEEVPRVDLDLEGGNRGYLIGQPPAAQAMRTTRQMVHADVELPSWHRLRPGATTGPLDDLLPPETEPAERAEGAVRVGRPGSFDTYVVQKGDSLWSIAGKPEVFGKASRWRELLEANEDLLSGHPDRLRAGMTLRIPRAREGADDDAGTTFRK